MVAATGVRIDEKGRLTIPREMRESLHIAPGDTVFLRADSDLQTLQLAKADNSFDILGQHALDEYRAGRTKNSRTIAEELGIDQWRMINARWVAFVLLAELGRRSTEP